MQFVNRAGEKESSVYPALSDDRMQLRYAGDVRRESRVENPEPIRWESASRWGGARFWKRFIIRTVSAAAVLVLGASAAMAAPKIAGQLKKADVEQIRTEDVVELGEIYAGKVADYITADRDDVYHEARLDASGVNTGKVGDYPVSISWLDQAFDVTVHVKDTVAPVVHTHEPGKLSFYVGEKVSAKDLAWSEDREPSEVFFAQKGSADSVLAFQEPGRLFAGSGAGLPDSIFGGAEKDIAADMQEETVTLMEPGTMTLSVQAVDAAGNVSVPVPVCVTVMKEEHSPVIEGTVGRSIVEGGSLPDFMEGAVAYDEEDGDLTDSLTVDISSVDANVPGLYFILYRVSDSAGNVTELTETFTVKMKAGSTKETPPDYEVAAKRAAIAAQTQKNLEEVAIANELTKKYYENLAKQDQ